MSSGSRPDLDAQLPAFEERLAEVVFCARRVGAQPQKLFEGVDDDLERIAGAAEGLRDRVRELAEGEVEVSTQNLRHDLRTPLNHILGYGEMLLQEAEELSREDLTDDLRRILELGREVLGSLDGLVRGLKGSAQSTPLAHVSGRRFEPVPGRRVTGRILVVDDNADNRLMLERRLARANHEVTEAEDGEQALALMAEHDFDLVLLDILMPGIDGTEVLSRMREDDRTKHVPVIVISGLDELPSVVRCIQLGADDYLAKPFEPVILTARIRACLEKKMLRDREHEYLGQIEAEKQRADELLNVIFPPVIAEELKQTAAVRPRRHNNVAVLFTDIVGFTAYSENREPEKVVANLQRLVVAFEEAALRHGLLKIKTIGDSFMAVAGLDPRLDNPVLNATRCGQELQGLVTGLELGWEVRVGIHVGPVVAGVLGKLRYQYDLWGDTVNTASRVEAHGVTGAVTLSAEAWRAIEDVDGASAASLGWVRMKGKGAVELFRFEGFSPP